MERRKRFGAPQAEKKERANAKQPLSNRRMFSGMSEEEKNKMEARMKRFGLSVQ